MVFNIRTDSSANATHLMCNDRLTIGQNTTVRCDRIFSNVYILHSSIVKRARSGDARTVGAT